MRLRLLNLAVVMSALLAGAVIASAEVPDVELRLADEEAKLDLLNEKLAALDDELAKLDSKETTLLGELHRLDIQIRVSGDELELLGLQLKRGYREIDANLKRIQALELVTGREVEIDGKVGQQARIRVAGQKLQT